MKVSRSISQPFQQWLTNGIECRLITSGANHVTGATTRALELLFGDKHDFVVTSLIAGTTPIQYHRFSEMADDVVDVRVYQGIHFRRADVVGRRKGNRPADWAVSHVLKPTN